MDDDLKQRLLATFRAEAEDHRRALTDCLLTLERGLDAEQEHEAAQTAFRVMHTLKGAARSVGLPGIEAICQAAELLLSRALRHGLPLTPARIRVLHDALGAVVALLAEDPEGRPDPELLHRLAQAATAEDEGAPPAAPPAPPSAPPLPRIELTPEGTIRLDADKLDGLLAQAEELLAAKLTLDARAQEASSLLARLTRSHAAKPDEAAARALAQRLDRDRHVIGTAVDRLLDATRRIRMMPVSGMLAPFPGMVSDLARAAGKEVAWEATGAGLELDRRVLERIKDPLIHLVRNAVDHGIEMPHERRVAGKPPCGRVAIAVAGRPDGHVEVVVEDDGRGMDLARLRSAAVRSNALSPAAAEELDEQDALELAFHPGLSTRPIVTEVSGHGLGLSIVREQVERLEGRVHVDTGPHGTRVWLLLPASIATFRGVLVRATGQSFLLPVRAVEQVLDAGRLQLGEVDGRAALRWRGERLPVRPLQDVLGLAPANGSATAPPTRACVVTGSAHERAVLLVDEVVGDQEVLVKELAPPLVRVRHVAGAGVLGSGRTVLILRAADLVRAARRAGPVATFPFASSSPTPSRRPRVLVVDDAVTTRTMERNLLEAAGYDVRVAVDGADAWAALRTEDFDLVVSDVDMPRMDGFELTSRIRADAQLAQLPVVLVTAMEAREDKERGIDAGANAYVVKSSFDQTHLLEIIDRLGVVAGQEARG